MSTNKKESATAKMIEENFFKNLKESGFAKKTNVSQTIKDIDTNYSTEEILINLYEVRDELIDSCSNLDIDSDSIKFITTSINKVGNCIRKLGGNAEDFDPINHVMGLQTPNMIKNAEKVAETTKQYYALGNIEEALVSNNGKTINIIFTGEKNNIQYRALGTITANSTSAWTGNEAIDYVYKTGSGKMFVRAFTNGKWTDKSDEYEILWELEENPINKEGKTNNNNEIDKVENNKENINDNFPINDESIK